METTELQHTIELEMAWMAGIVDGEGCITISKQRREGRPSLAFRTSITISNTNLKLLEPFVKWWGGGIYSPRQANSKWRQTFTWHCSNGVAVKFLESIMPYLKGKRRQAELVLEFEHNKKRYKRTVYRGKGSAPLSEEETKYRDGLRDEIKKLNARGPSRNDSSFL